MLKKTDILDLETFTQLIELDENEGTDFLESVAIDWFIQAEDTFIKMDKKLYVCRALDRVHILIHKIGRRKNL